MFDTESFQTVPPCDFFNTKLHEDTSQENPQKMCRKTCSSSSQRTADQSGDAFLNKKNVSCNLIWERRSMFISWYIRNNNLWIFPNTYIGYIIYSTYIDVLLWSTHPPPSLPSQCVNDKLKISAIGFSASKPSLFRDFFTTKWCGRCWESCFKV